MNTSGSSNNFITRRDFMKKSALTVGAITLLSQGIGLAAGSSGSGGLSWLKISVTRSTSLARTVNVTVLGSAINMDQSMATAVAKAVELMFATMGNSVDNYTVGDPNDFKSADRYDIDMNGSTPQIDYLGNDQWQVTISGVFSITHTILEPK